MAAAQPPHKLNVNGLSTPRAAASAAKGILEASGTTHDPQIPILLWFWPGFWCWVCAGLQHKYRRRHKYPPRVSKPTSFFITPRSVFMNAHIHHLAHTSTTRWSRNSQRYCEDTVAVIKFLSVILLCSEANTVRQKPIRAGFVLVLKSLHKGQSLRVALGEVCAMEKCSQPLLLSCHWPCVI